ncbi:MAG: M20/M25/M40 family metallo-hydrolase [Chloroflexota bacterium]
MARTDLPGIIDESVEHLRQLVRFRTVNPPGEETQAARYLKEVFEREGIPAEVVEPQAGRGSVVARLQGDGRQRPLLLLSHIDVVPAVAKDWAHDPFGAELINGEVWGRGTQDCKNAAATWLAIMIRIKRLGLTPSRDIIFAATADEEMGGVFGARWLAENRWDLIDAEYCLNEGGGGAVSLGNKLYYTYQTGEKSVCWFRLTAKGTAGHASVPLPDNPVVVLAETVGKLGRARLPLHITPTVTDFVKGLAAAQPESQRELLLRILDPSQTEAVLAKAVGGGQHVNDFNAMLRNTATPTILRAGEKTNVIPSEAICDVDGRILPGQTADDLIREIRAVIGDAVQVEFNRTGTPTESDPRTPLADAITRAIARHAPEASVVPFLVPGATDARYLRPRGMTVYGFVPTLPDVDAKTVHGVNERLPVSSFAFGVKVTWDVVAELARLDA